jgi:putative ATP-binding cassette transporter
VQTALSFFVSSYRQLAEWRAVVERLAGFEAAVDAGRRVARSAEAIKVEPQPHLTGVEIGALDLRLPNGAPLLAAENVKLAPGGRVLVIGASGSGKSTLFRAIAGIWPFGSGKIAAPAEARLMMLPQRPYFPVGSLLAAVTYPALPGHFPLAEVRDVLDAVGLGALHGRLDEEAHWNRMLSLGEQERLALARAILHAPDYLFLDEATASLDEASEAALYRLLQRRLPGTAIVSIGHRSTLRAFHRRLLALERDGDRHRLRERSLEPAAAGP